MAFDPEREFRTLRHRFRPITARHETMQKPRRLARRWGTVSLVVAVTVGLAVGGLMMSPWPVSETLKHLAAFPN